MRVLVLSTGNPLLENALLADGHTVTSLQPTGTAAVPGTARHTIDRWDDLVALSALEPDLPAVDAVATIDEQAIVAAAHLRQLRNLPGLNVAAAYAYTDKATMKGTLAAAGLPVARHRVVHHADQVPAAAAELGGWPVLVKPRAGLASLNTFAVRNEDLLRKLVQAKAFDTRAEDPTGRFAAGHVLDSLHEAPHGFLVEKFLDVTTEYFVDLYVHRGTVLLTVPGRYDAPLLQSVGGASFDTVLPCERPEVREVVALAVRAAAALGEQTGVVHCEILRDRTRGLFVGEVAARPGGGCITELASLMYGFELPSTLAALAADQIPDLDDLAYFPALTAVMIAAPAGTVTHVADRTDIEDLPGVLHADIRLAPGQPAPAGVGTMTFAGRILYVPNSLDTLDQEIADLRAALDIRTAEPAAA